MNDSIQSDLLGSGSPDSDFPDDQLRRVVVAALSHIPASARVLTIIPDKTRDDNSAILFPAAQDILHGRGVSTFDVLVAQGTHGPMTNAEKLAKVGLSDFRGQMFDHNWDDASELVSIGELSAETVREITGGVFDETIELSINKLLAPGAYDVVLVFGATMPHEVAGFAGGAKYIFPGVAGPELTHKTHWLAALAGIENIIGQVETPTRHLIEAAAVRLQAEIITFTSVCTRTTDEGLRTHALFAGDFQSSVRAAAEVSKKVHVRYTGRKYRRVVALLDEKYTDLWVGGKASYRLGGVIEEGGELIIHAPQLTCISDTHGAAIERFGGYAPIETIKDLVAASGELQSNLCVAAHLAHVAYAAKSGSKAEPRFRITLSSQLDEATCRKINLEYLNPTEFRLSQYADENTLIVERAGRDLYLVAPV